MIPVEDVQALRAEAKALRAEVREVVAIARKLAGGMGSL